MKSKKRVGTKAQIRAIKEREKHIAIVIFLVFILLIVILSSYFTYNFLNQPQNQTTNPASSQLKAAIIDQLSLTFPNQTFVETATNTLKQAGYTVDYYPGDNVTVEFYKNLPSHGYKLIIFRVHTTERGAFFTSEPYSSSSYVWEQLKDQVWKASYDGNAPFYFGISPAFVKSYMNGRLHEAVVIAMGCYTLKFNDMADAFIEKGAKVYIGWSGSVLSSHTDLATTHLLQHLLIEKQTIKKAVVQTIEEVGPDPEYEGKSVLLALPEEAWDSTIQTP